MTFEKIMQGAKLKLDETKESFQRSEIFRGMEAAYLTQINQLIEQLNTCQDIQRSEILKQIKEMDKLYLLAKGIEITGHILFSRHGKCSMLGQKKLGLSPNTAISEEAAQNMKATNKSSGDLLFYSANGESPYIAISPMNRAMQTAGLVIPEKIKNAVISVEPFLVENSDAPSGYDVRSKADMQKLYDQLSFWKTPIKKFLLKISMWIYSDEDFKQLYEKRKNAAAKIQAHGNTILNFGDDDNPDVRQNLDYNRDKIADTKAFIEQVDQRDCWFFGHGKNFHAFFQKVFGNNSAFDYGETRSVYKVKANGKASLFSPPYVMVINQETGKIEGKYTATVSMSMVEKAAITQKAHQSEEEIPYAPQAMCQLGESVLGKRKQTDLGNEKEITPEDSVVVLEQQHHKIGYDQSHLIVKKL